MPKPPEPNPPAAPYPDLDKLTPSQALLAIARHVARQWGWTDGKIKIIIERADGSVKYKIKGRI